VPIHVIGGIGDKSTAGETTAFVRAVRETGCLGGSMYNWSTTDDADWRALQNIRFNPRQRPALPVAVGYTAPLGNCRQDSTHPKEVFFTAAGQDGDRVLRLRLWDVQADELRLIVNWREVLTFVGGPKDSWTKVRTVKIPAKLWHASGHNVIGIVARGDAPDWRRWGVRDLTLSAQQRRPRPSVPWAPAPLHHDLVERELHDALRAGFLEARDDVPHDVLLEDRVHGPPFSVAEVRNGGCAQGGEHLEDGVEIGRLHVEHEADLVERRDGGLQQHHHVLDLTALDRVLPGVAVGDELRRRFEDGLDDAQLVGAQR